MLDLLLPRLNPEVMRYLVFLLSLIALPLSAQEIVLKTLDVSTSIPAPPWTETHKLASESESVRQKRLSQRGTDVFLRAYVPKGQNFDVWETRYDVTAETPVSGDAESHRNAYAIAYRQKCKNAALAPIQQTPKRQVFILYCPAFLETPEFGEMIIAVAERQGKTLVQVNYHERVPAFDLTKRESFPKTQDELRDLVRYLNAARLVPS